MDKYIDQHETQAYGVFSAQQIPAVVAPLDPVFGPVLAHLTALLSGATMAVAQAVAAASGAVAVTFAGAEGAPVDAARDALKRLVRYAESRPAGEALATAILGGEALSTVQRRRPVKLASALDRALVVVDREKAQIPEHAVWTAEIGAKLAALRALDQSVRASRIDRKEMTPLVAAARTEWLRVYGAAKLVVEAVLRLHGKLQLMTDVFDDLAEVHRAPGVTDDAAPPTEAVPLPA